MWLKKECLSLALVSGLIGTILMVVGCESRLEYDAEAVATCRSEEFYGNWYTDLPNGERWLLSLLENGEFIAQPVRNSRRSPGYGTWKVENGAIHWRYAQLGNTQEMNPIIMKTADRFMLQERMGMQSLYYKEKP